MFHFPRSEAYKRAIREMTENEQTQEKSMINSDYKRGVEDATKGPCFGEITVTDGFNSHVLQTFLNNRRKRLLTRKVTKWINVYNDCQLEWVPIRQGVGLYDSEELAKAKNPERYSGYLGTYPVEIDVPL